LQREGHNFILETNFQKSFQKQNIVRIQAGKKCFPAKSQPTCIIDTGYVVAEKSIKANRPNNECVACSRSQRIHRDRVRW